MRRTLSSACVLLVVAAAIIINGCGGNSNNIINNPPIAVSLSASPTSVPATGTISLTATVSNDGSGKGVTWTVSCGAIQCGSVASNAATAATYTAPSTPPGSDLAVTIKATAVADSTKSATAPITVLAITLSASPTTANLQVGASNPVQIQATVNNDPTNQGVKFTVSSPSPGTLNVQDAFDAAYDAPTTPPANETTVVVTATSIEDSSKTATVTITVPSVVVSVTPSSVTVDATATVPNIVATLGNDPSGKGVNWTAMCSPAPCGSLSNMTTLSGAPTTYNAPTTPPVPSDLAVTLTATSVAEPAAQGSMTITVKAISITLTVPNSTLQYDQTEPNIVAVVNDDPAKQGVTWTVQPCGVTDCGSIAPGSAASGAAVTYSAPIAPVANNLGVTLVAASVSAPTQTSSTTITVPAIIVTAQICTEATCSTVPGVMSRWPDAVIPVNADPNLNATSVIATVNYDTKNQGVSWTLSQGSTACASICGSVTPGTSPSGTAVAYAAPDSVPTNPSLTLTATSVSDTSKTSAAAITLAPGTVKLIPAQINFGGLKISSKSPHPTRTLTQTLANTGTTALNITAQAVTGTAFSLSSDCLGSAAVSVPAATSCGINVTFSPPSAGSFGGDLGVTDNATGSPQQIALSGRGCHTVVNCVSAPSFKTALAANPMTSVPAPTGGNQVGTRVMELRDSNRVDPYLANGTKRELQVRFWYPAHWDAACKPAEYTSPGVWNYLAQLEKVPAPQVKTNSCMNAAMTTGLHPVVVLTHGYTGTFTDYTFLAEDLASRGYVVASVNHTFEATAVQFPDGRLVKSVLGNHLQDTMTLDEKATTLAVAVRLADLRFVVDELTRLNASRTGPFAGKLDLSRVAIAGHSLGGMTALLGLELEPRFRAAISLDGVVPGTLFGNTTKPVLMLFAGRDAWDQDTCHLWGALHGPRLALSFKGSEHLTPSDAVWLAEGAIHTGTVGMEKTVASIREYAAAFLDANLKGSPRTDGLTGSSVENPDVEIIRRTPSACAIQQHSAASGP